MFSVDQTVFRKLEKIGRIGTWTVDLSTQKVWWSNVTYEIHDVPMGTEITVEKGINFYLEEYRSLIRSSIENSIKNEKPWDIEIQIQTLSGEIKWVRAAGEVILDKGKVVGLQGIFQDLESQKKVSNELWLANKKISLAMESARIGFWDWDVQSDILSWDKSMYNIYEVEDQKKAAAYSIWSNALHPEDRERVEREVQVALASVSNFDTEFRIVCSGRVKHIRAIANVFFSNNKPVNMVGINWDVTKEREASLEVRQKNYELQAVFDAIPGLVIHKSVDDRLLRVNKYAADLMNTTTDKMSGRPSKDFYDSELCEAYHKDDLEVIKSGKPKLGIVEQVNKSDGSLSWIKTDKVPYKEADGTVSGIVLCSFDISGQVKVQEQLKQLNEELTQFSYRTSHDLKAPLSTIRGLTQIAKQQVANKDLIDAQLNLDKISNLTLRLENLVKDLLNLTKSEHMDLSHVEPFDFEKEIADILNTFSDQQPSLFHVKICVKDVPLLQVVRLRQVLENLISNAIKYKDISKKEHVIEISVVEENKTYKISIKDNGLGISEEQHAKVFGMFQRFHHDIEGSGLGLYLVKKHLQKLNGEIRFKSASGEGSLFEVCLFKE